MKVRQRRRKDWEKGRNATSIFADSIFFLDGSLISPRRRQKRAARMLNSTRESPHLSVNTLLRRKQTKRCPRTVISNQPRKSIQFDVEYGYPRPTG